MNANKPVAYISKNGVLFKELPPEPMDLEPLYLVKELTDEEIDIALYVADITLNNLSDGDISMERIKAFVRTILRKAQEK